tara:strand:+ start:202 stop:966 length:765 start_codon:yes stop_codon:yes gene_type:complete
MNVVFIPNVKLNDNRNSPYHYSVKSWKSWAENYDDVMVIEWTDPIMDPAEFKITLQRYWVHDILEHNGIDYEQVLVVDADTIVHPDCPNFFEETNGEFSVVLNSGCYEWTTRSITDWGNALFPNQSKIKVWEYFNGGFQITSKKHIDFYKTVQNYYLNNIDKINEYGNKIKAGTDQTIINYLVSNEGVNKKYLPECYNLQDLFRKSLLHIPGHSWFKDELGFLEAGYVYHFNAIPQNERHVAYWMERTYKELYE